MSFEFKIKIIFFAVLLTILTSGFLYYKRMKTPKSEPPKPKEEVTVTIIPGWNLRDIGNYLSNLGFASSSDQVYLFTGKPAVLKPGLNARESNLEGYLSPETYRVFKDAKLPDIIEKFKDQRTKEFNDINFKGNDEYKIVTMASLIEKEARAPEDRRLVSDILWRRVNKNWLLQLDSTVHYAVDRTGDPYTTESERATKSPWNTYLYPGLPPGPICTPSLDSIDAALNPTSNNNWYFLTGTDGEMHYARTLDEHNANRRKYLK